MLWVREEIASRAQAASPRTLAGTPARSAGVCDPGGVPAGNYSFADTKPIFRTFAIE
jgi:hypothetical protein